MRAPSGPGCARPGADTHPRQDQKSRVVGEEADVPPARFRAPADIVVAAAQMTRRRTPRQTGNRPPVRPHQILQMFAHRLLIAKVMMLFHQTVEQRLISGSSYLLKLQRPRSPSLPSSASCRSARPRVSLGLPADCAAHSDLRQFDPAGPVEHQQQAAANHVAQSPVGLSPLPGLAQLRGQRAAAGARMRGDQLAYI